MLIGRPTGSRTSVERELEAGEPLVVDAGIAEHLRSDGRLWVRATLFAVEAEAGKLQLRERARLVRRRLALDIDEPVCAVRDRSVYGLLLQPQHACSDGCLGAGVAHLARIGVDGRRLLAERERRSHRVEDRPTPGRQSHGRLGLRLRHGGERRRAHGGDPRLAREEPAEDENGQDQEQAQSRIDETAH
jgi:hypothetical protein